jgi:hypothetical protein
MEGPKKRYPSLSPAATDEAPREAAVRETSVISRKELAREYRRQAYQRAKQARATDPKHLAMKEAAKVRRREAYQQVKAKRKEHEAEFKARRKVADAASREESQRQLAQRVRGALQGDAFIPSVTSALSAGGDVSRPAGHHRAGSDGAGGDGGRGDVAREVAEALEDPNIKDLMARLRAESARLAQLAAQQQSPLADEDACLPSEGRPETSR